jgi:hypothetical protein
MHDGKYVCLHMSSPKLLYQIQLILYVEPMLTARGHCHV